MSEQPAPEPENDSDLKDFGHKGMEFADASVWVSRVFSAFVPGLIGLWLDNRYGTRYWAPIGLVLGVTSGILGLVQATKGVFKKPDRSSARNQQSSENQSSAGRKLP